jgi:hypothetical protein
MDDLELIDAFVNGGAQRAFGETLHVEGDVILIDGFWHAALRVTPECFTVRSEEPPIEGTTLQDIERALTARGLAHVMDDHPGIPVLTMAKASLGFVPWAVWGTDAAAADAALAKAVNEESFFQDTEYYNPTAETDYTAELHGARRLAGLPTSLILSIGLDEERLDKLGAALGDCVFTIKQFGEIEPDVCGSMVPTLILVDATEQRGREFVMALRAASCSRVLPLVGVTADGSTPLGADTGLGADQDPAAWAPPIRTLLP